MPRLCIVFGTRPELIKLAPVVHAARHVEGLDVTVLSTGQHRDMLVSLLDWFEIAPDIDLGLMKPAQTPQSLLARCLEAMDDVLARRAFDALVVQGDTSTALAGALAAFHRRVPVGHVEAGLRTGDIASPFPEEANRALIGRLARWNFAPTSRAAAALEDERVPGTIAMTGNTVVDALRWTDSKLGRTERSSCPEAHAPMILVTLHRRESFGAPMRESFRALATLAERYPQARFTYPVHRNPAVLEPATAMLGRVSNIDLTEPLDYPALVDRMRRAHLVITDSGGIQEEAPSFGVPIVILRDRTERPEVIEAGIGHLVGTDHDKIVAVASGLLDKRIASEDGADVPDSARASSASPFGDGRAAERIVTMLGTDLAAEPRANQAKTHL